MDDEFGRMWERVTARRSNSDPPALDFDSMYQRVSSPGLIDRAKDVGSQFARGLADAGASLGSSVIKGVRALQPRFGPARAYSDRALESLDAQREKAHDFYGEAETGLGTAAGMAGRIAPEIVSYMAGGGVARAAVPALGRLAARGTAARVASDAIAVAPLDALIAGTDRQNSVAGALSEFTDSPTLDRIAANPLGRIAVEVGTGVVGDAAISGIAAGARRAVKPLDVTDDVTTGIREGLSGVEGARPREAVAPLDPRVGRTEEVAAQVATEDDVIAAAAPRELPAPSGPASPVRPDDDPLSAFATTSTGSVDFGEVTPELSAIISREAAPIRLTKERALYIWDGHARELQSAGYGSAGEFVEEVTSGFAEVFQTPKRDLVFVKPGEKSQGLVYTRLTGDPGGPHYSIGSGHPVDDIERRTREWERLYGGTSRTQSPEVGPPSERAIHSGEVEADPSPGGSAITDPVEPQPKIDDPSDPRKGGAVPALTRAIAGGGIGATAGATIAPEGEKGTYALTLGAVGAGVGAATTKRSLGTLTDVEVAKLADRPELAEAISSVQRSAPADGATGTWTERAKSMGRSLRYKLSRDVLPMEALEREITGGTELRDVLAQARGWRGSASMHIETDLQPVIEAAKDSPELVRRLAEAERGLELASLGKELAPDQRAAYQTIVDQLGADDTVRSTVDQLRAFYRSLLDMKREAGVLTTEQFDDIVAQGQHYVPWLPEEIAASGGGILGGGSKYGPNRSTGVRKMTDRLNDVAKVDPINQAITDAFETHQKVAKQRATNVLVGLVESDPVAAAAFMREVDIQRGPGGQPLRPRIKDSERYVEGIVDGQRRAFIVTDKDLANAWAGFNRGIESRALRAVNGMRRFMQAGITGNPVFGIVNGIRDFLTGMVQYPIKGGLARQAGTAALGAAAGASVSEDKTKGAGMGAALALTAGGAPHLAKHIGRSVSAMNDILGPQVMGAVFGGTTGYLSADDEDSGLQRFLAGMALGAGAGSVAGRVGLTGNRAIYDEFLREGGGGFGFYARNSTDAKRIRARLEKDGVSAVDFVNPKSWWDAVQHVARAIETAPRLARYKDVRAGGGSIGAGIFEARDISLDFSVKPGSKALDTLTKAIPFLNPSIQGMDKLVRLMSTPETAAVAGATILAPTVALWQAIHSDPEIAAEYQGRPVYERNTYWLLPKKWFGQDGGFFRVPKPFEIGFIYASVPERMLDYAEFRDPDQLKHSLGDMWNTYGPASMAGAPMPVGPLLEANIGEHGYDTFRNRAINPHPWSNISPEMQLDERTSTVAIALNRLPGVKQALDLVGLDSPAQIDFAIRGYTGTLGSEALDATSRIARRVGLDDRPEPARASRAFAGRFHTDPSVTTETEIAMRRKLDRGERARNDLKMLLESGDQVAARELVQERRDDLLLYSQMRGQDISRFLDAASDARRKIRESDASTEEKRALLEALNQHLALRLQPQLEQLNNPLQPASAYAGGR